MIKYICPIHGKINPEETFSMVVNYGSSEYASEKRCFRCVGDFLEKNLSPLEKIYE